MQPRWCLKTINLREMGRRPGPLHICICAQSLAVAAISFQDGTERLAFTDQFMATDVGCCPVPSLSLSLMYVACGDGVC